MSKRKEMIRVLDSISDFNTYSRYSNILSKLFKNNCLKDLVSSLKNPLHVDIYEIFKNDEDKNKNKNALVPINQDQNSNPKNKKKELDLLNDNGDDIEEEKNNKENKDKLLNKNLVYNVGLDNRNQRLKYFELYKLLTRSKNRKRKIEENNTFN